MKLSAAAPDEAERHELREEAVREPAGEQAGRGERSRSSAWTSDVVRRAVPPRRRASAHARRGPGGPPDCAHSRIGVGPDAGSGAGAMLLPPTRPYAMSRPWSGTRQSRTAATTPGRSRRRRRARRRQADLDNPDPPGVIGTDPSRRTSYHAATMPRSPSHLCRRHAERAQRPTTDKDDEHAQAPDERRQGQEGASDARAGRRAAGESRSSLPAHGDRALLEASPGVPESVPGGLQPPTSCASGRPSTRPRREPVHRPHDDRRTIPTRKRRSLPVVSRARPPTAVSSARRATG